MFILSSLTSPTFIFFENNTLAGASHLTESREIMMTARTFTQELWKSMTTTLPSHHSTDES